MQAVIAIPDLETLQQYGGAEQALMREVCGVPLLVRMIKTSLRAGVSSLVVMWPASVPQSIWLRCQAALVGERVDGITLVHPASFRPRETASWTAIAGLLDESFLWLPWNFVTHKRALLELCRTAGPPAGWNLPAIIDKQAVLGEGPVPISPGYWPEGVLVTSKQTALETERFLVVRSGKPLDGIYSTFNRKLCRPVVRLRPPLRSRRLRGAG